MNQIREYARLGIQFTIKEKKELDLVVFRKNKTITQYFREVIKKDLEEMISNKEITEGDLAQLDKM